MNRKRGIAWVWFLVIMLFLVAGVAALIYLRGTTVTLKNMTEVSFSDELCRYHIDKWDITENKKGEVIIDFSGWAIDGDTNLPFKSVYLSVNEKTTALEKRDRPDVASAFSLQGSDIRYGFVGKVKLGKANRIKDDVVRLIFVYEDGKTYCTKELLYNDPTLAGKQIDFEDNCRLCIDRLETWVENGIVFLDISGWAFDKVNLIPFRDIFVRVNDKNILLGKRDRPDVVSAFKLEASGTAAYGFSGVVDLGPSEDVSDSNLELLFAFSGSSTYCVSSIGFGAQQIS